MVPLEELRALDGAGEEIKVIDQPEVPAWMRTNAGAPDPDDREYAVPVKWLVTRDAAEVVQEAGLFAKQHSACRLSDERTIRLVSEAFDVD